ncbi:MAG: SUMF1/EgtB/PvdO family nonheme iron enzyme [Gemmatimonadota bacterium]
MSAVLPLFLLLPLGSCDSSGTEPNLEPLAEFSISCVNLACTFTDESVDSDGVIESWHWNFGDGGTSLSHHPTHTYAAPGTYRVTLRVTDDENDTVIREKLTNAGSDLLGLGLDDEQFVLIPAGTFLMGDQAGNGDNGELPVHEVTISEAFLIQKTEVTLSQWMAIMAPEDAGNDVANTSPVYRHLLATWNGIANRFLPTLNAMYPDRQYRLPTEAEWEYAARAGTAEDYVGDLDDVAWYAANAGGTPESPAPPHPVAQKQPNAWGLYDIHGNVEEWVQDWFDPDYYSSSPDTDPTGPGPVFDLKVRRGGSCLSDAKGLRLSARRRGLPGEEGSNVSRVGFRLVRKR